MSNPYVTTGWSLSKVSPRLSNTSRSLPDLHHPWPLTAMGSEGKSFISTFHGGKVDNLRLAPSRPQGIYCEGFSVRTRAAPALSPAASSANASAT
jgi:hypothetical protein